MTDEDAKELENWTKKQSSQESKPLGWVFGCYGAPTRMDLHPKVFAVSTIPNPLKAPPVQAFIHPSVGFQEATSFLREMANFLDGLAAAIDETTPANSVH